MKKLTLLTSLLAAMLASQVNGAQIIGTDFSDAPVFQQTGGNWDLVNLDDLNADDGITVGQWVNLGSGNAGAWITHTDNNVYTGTPGFIPPDRAPKLDGITTRVINVGDTWPSDYGNYFEITIPAGVTLNLTSLQFDWRAATGGGTSGRELAFGTDVSGTPICTYNVDGIGRNDVPSPLLDVIDLSGPEFQGLTDRTLRFYFTAVEGTGSGDLEGDNIILNGEVLLGATLVWVGDGSANTWETNSLSWTNVTDGGGLTKYEDLDSVIFDDSSANTLVTLNSTVTPKAVTVTVETNDYVLQGSPSGGVNGGTLAKQGSKSLTLSGNLAASFESAAVEGALMVNSSAAVSLGDVSGSGTITQTGAGTLTVAAGTLDGSLTVEAGSKLGVEGTPTVSSLTFASGTTSLDIVNSSGASTIITAPNFTNSGTVAISYTTSSYLPGTTTALIDYGSNSVVGAYSLNALPGGVVGSLVTNVVNSSIDLVITSVPAKLWVGNVDNNWDILTTANWSGGTTFANGNSVKFDDTGANTDPIAVAFGGVSPGLMWVANSTRNYTFKQDSINTPTLVKQGTGTLTLQAQNSFTNVDIQAGTLSYSSEFGGAYSENGRVTGPGTLQVEGLGTFLTLGGDMSGFEGPIVVNAGSTLKLGRDGTLGTADGTTTIANTAELDINGNYSVQGEHVFASGQGAGLVGAIINSSAAPAQDALDHVTLAGDTTFGGVSRWDIRPAGTLSTTNLAILDTTGGAVNITKAGDNQVALVSVDISPNINNIDITAGNLSVEHYTTSMGNPAGTVTVQANAQLTFFKPDLDVVPVWTKDLVLSFGSRLRKAGGGSVQFNGPITLNGDAEFQGNAGELLVTGPVSSYGSVNKSQGGIVSLLGVNTYTGNTTVSNGTLKISTATGPSLTGAVTVDSGGTFGATVTAVGTTLSIPTLTLGNGGGTAGLVFDLGSLGKPTAPVMQVTTTLTPNAATYPVTVQADVENLTLTGGTPVTLLKYPAGQFTNQVVATLPAGVTGVVTNNTAVSEIQLTITTVTRALTWVGNESSDWDINNSINWLSGTLLTTYREIGVGDPVTFPDSASNFVVSVAQTVNPSSILVTGTNDYTIGGAFSIAGPTVFEVNTASGTTVSLTGNNTYTGGTDIDNGTVVISTDANLGDPSGFIKWRGGVLQVTESLTNSRPLVVGNTAAQNILIVESNKTVLLGGTYTTNGAGADLEEEFVKDGEGTLILTNSGLMRLWVDGGTAILAGSCMSTNPGGDGAFQQFARDTNQVATLILRDDAVLQTQGDFNVATGTDTHGTLRVQDNALLSLGELFLARAINATGLVYQTGGMISNRVDSGSDYWNFGGNDPGDSNAFGGFYLSAGITDLGVGNNKGLLLGDYGRGLLAISGTGVWNTRGNRDTILGVQGTGVGSIMVSESGQLNVLDPAHELVLGQLGAGTLTVTNGGTVSSLGPVQMAANTNSSGAVQVASGGTLAAAAISKGLGSSATLMVDGGTIAATASSATFLQGLSSATIGAGGMTVDTDVNDITINQPLGGAGGLTKAGSGTLTLPAGPVGFSGPVVVNAGTLSGGLVGTPLQFSSSLTVNANGIVAPGTSIGEIACIGAVTVSGKAQMEIKKGLFSNASDQILSAGGITFGGGTVDVVFDATSDTAVTVGTTFKLFNPAVGGSYTLNPPAKDPVNGNLLTWTDNLALDGTISVKTLESSVVTDPPPTLTTVVAGGNYLLSWGGEYEGYTLQSQTNALSVGLRDSWVSIPGTETMTNYTQAINPADPTVFFQLVYTNAP